MWVYFENLVYRPAQVAVQKQGSQICPSYYMYFVKVWLAYAIRVWAGSVFLISQRCSVILQLIDPDCRTLFCKQGIGYLIGQASLTPAVCVDVSASM